MGSGKDDLRKRHLSQDLKNEGDSVNFQTDRAASNGKKLAISEREKVMWLQYREQGRMVSDWSENKLGHHHRSSEVVLII